MRLKRLVHRLFRRHVFRPFWLGECDSITASGDALITLWYKGYRCKCGEPGYGVPR